MANEREYVSQNQSIDHSQEADDYVRWQEQGNCLGVDPDLFFPERGASTKEAKEVCMGCVVRLECLEFALETNEKFGIWGGLSERQRRRLRRQRTQSTRTTIPYIGGAATHEVVTADADIDEF